MTSPERSSHRASSEGRKIGSKKKLSRTRAKSETEIKNERSESAAPAPDGASASTAAPASATSAIASSEGAGLDRKSSGKKRRSFFKRSRSSSTGRTQSKDRGEADVVPPDSIREPQATSTDVASPREVLSDDEDNLQKKPRDRFRRMTVKEAMMQKKVKRVSSTNAISSSRRRRAEAGEEQYGQDDDNDYAAEVASIRTLSASSPDLHRDDKNEFTPRRSAAGRETEPSTNDNFKTTTKQSSSSTKGLKADKIQKVIKSTSPSRAKSNKSSKSIEKENERPDRVSRKEGGVCYIKVSKDVKQTGKKTSPSPHRRHHYSSPSRPSSRSRSPGSRSRKESRDRTKHSSEGSKSPRRRVASRSPKVSRSQIAKSEYVKKMQTQSTEKEPSRFRRTEGDSAHPPRGGHERRYSEYDDESEIEDEEMSIDKKAPELRHRHPEIIHDDADMDEDEDDQSHALFIELSKTLSPYCLSPAGQEKDLQAVSKYNFLRRSTSNLLLTAKEEKSEDGPSKMDSLAVVNDTRHKSASPRFRSPITSDADSRYNRQGSRDVHHLSGSSRESGDTQWKLDDDPMSPTSPTWSVFDDYSSETSPTSPTFPISPSNKYTRTFSPTRNRTKEKKSSSSSRNSYEGQPEKNAAATESDNLDKSSRISSRHLSGSGLTKSSLEQDVIIGTDTSPTSTSPLSTSPTSKFGPTPTITLSKPSVIGVKATSPSADPSPSSIKPDATTTPKSTVPSLTFKSIARSIIPSRSTKSCHSVPIPTVSVPHDNSTTESHSRSGSIKDPKTDPDRDKLTINIPRVSQVDEDSLSPPIRGIRSKTPTRTSSVKSQPKSPTKPLSPGHKSSSTSTDGSGSAKYSHPSTSRSPSPRSASIVDTTAGSSGWFEKTVDAKVSPTRKGDAEPILFFPEVDIVQDTTANPEAKEKKAKKVQRSFSERDASKRPMPRISEILVKTDSMRKITRISAEDVDKLKEMANNKDRPLGRKGDKLTSSESALEKAGEISTLLDAEELKKDKDKKEKKKSDKRWSLKGRSRKEAVEKKKEKEDKKKSKKEKEKDKKTSKKVKKSDSSVSKKDEDDINSSVCTQTVLLGNHLSGITLDVEADFDPDLQDFERWKDTTNHSSWPAIVMLKHRLACQRRLRTGMDIDNDEELRELNLLNQLVRQPLDAPIPIENETNLLKSLDIRETALIGDTKGHSGLPHKLDSSKSQQSLDDPEFVAKRAQMRRESKVFRMIERRRKILSCIKKFIAFLFSHIGLCSLVVAYSIMGGFVFKALEGPYEQKNVVNVTALRMDTISKISQLSVELNLTKLSRLNFTKQVDHVLVTFQQNVHNATKNDVYYTSSNDEELDIKWSYASSLLYAITVMTTIGYGHVAPKTVHGRIVTIIYAVLGIPLTLLCLTNIGNLMADGFRILYGKVCCGLCCLLFKPRRRRIHDPELGGVQAIERKVEKSNEVIKVPTSLCILLIASYIFAGALLFSLWEDWDYLTGSYFCFITLSTIGFGDIVPGTDIKSWSQQEKLVLCALYLVIGLSLIAMCFNLVQEDVKAKCIWLGRKFGIIDKDDSELN